MFTGARNRQASSDPYRYARTARGARHEPWRTAYRGTWEGEGEEGEVSGYGYVASSFRVRGSGPGVRFEGLLDLDVVVFGKPAGGRCSAGEMTCPELGAGVGGAEECLEAQDWTIVTIEGREAAWFRI